MLDLNQLDLNNLIVAARRLLPNLTGADLVNVATSIANIEAACAPKPLTEKPPEKSDG